MKTQEWLKTFDKNFPKFKWFIEGLFMGRIFMERLTNNRARGNAQEMFTVLNHIWYKLPDNQFNIIENPKGWAEFLELLENPPE